MALITYEDIIFYDFEVFPFYWCVVVNDYNSDEYIIIDDREALLRFYYENKDKIFVGYYSNFYDKPIFKAILGNLNPYTISIGLTELKKKSNHLIPKAIDMQYPIYGYDAYDGQHSLKQLEAFMGMDIRETEVDFKLNRPLTQEEISLTHKYCKHDVYSLKKFFIEKEKDSADFKAQTLVINYFNLSLDYLSKTKAQITPVVLETVRQKSIPDEFDLRFPKTAILSEKYNKIFEWYLKPENHTYRKIFATDKTQSGNWKKEISVNIANVPHVLGYGGIHGSLDGVHVKGIILCLDVSSLYPSLMIVYELLSRKVKNPKKYAEIKQTRIEYKKAKNIINLALKLILNSTYGILKAKDNDFYDPLMSNLVCVFGQMLLVDLIEKVEPYGKLYQSNTDGIYLLVDSLEKVEKIKEIAHEWEKRTQLELEFDIYDELYQKDVNNYILIKNLPNGKKKYKSKGSYLKKKKIFDNDLPIITTALIKYFVNKIPIEDTINKCDDLIEFQKVIKLTEKYQKVMIGDTKNIKIPKNNKDKYIQVMNHCEPVHGKVHRIFASKNITDGGIYKIKLEDGYEIAEKLPYTSNHMFIYNDDVSAKKCPEYLDKQFYVNLTYDRLNQILACEEEKVDETPKFLFSCMKKSNNYIDFLRLVNQELKVNTKNFKKYVIANCCNKYGKTKKLLDFIDYFVYFNNKKNINISNLEKKFSLKYDIIEIVKNNSELNKSGKSLNINNEIVLKSIFNSLKNEELPIKDILLMQANLFEKLKYTDLNLEPDLYVVQNYCVNITPTVILYQLSTGKIIYCFVNERSYKTLPLYDGDIIKASSFKKDFGYKMIGKDDKGINQIAKDTNKEIIVLDSYKILDNILERSDIHER